MPHIRGFHWLWRTQKEATIACGIVPYNDNDIGVIDENPTIQRSSTRTQQSKRTSQMLDLKRRPQPTTTVRIRQHRAAQDVKSLLLQPLPMETPAARNNSHSNIIYDDNTRSQEVAAATVVTLCQPYCASKPSRMVCYT